MLDTKIYGQYETAWCPGCGNHDILAAVKRALAICDLAPEKVVMMSGIGQASKAPQYVSVNSYSGLHGRAIPAATGVKLANPQLNVIVQSGDGCLYGEGGNHFMAVLRRNVDITIVVHNNGVYGLTKGQVSPTGTCHLHLKSSPFGIINHPFHPLSMAITLGAGFVARGFSGDRDNLPQTIAQAIKYPGLALVDIVSPCVSFNKYNTFAWYKQHCRPLPAGYDSGDRIAALTQAEKWEDEIPLGILYKRENPSPTFESHFPSLKQGPLYRQATSKAALEKFQARFY